MALTDNNKIKISNLKEVSEYLYDDYLEYFYNVEDIFFKNSISRICSLIIYREQEEFLKFIINKYSNYINISFLESCICSYKGKEKPEKITKIIFEKYPKIKSNIISDDYFKKIIKCAKFEFVKVIYNLRDKLDNKHFKLFVEDYHNYHFCDVKVFFWLFEKNIFVTNKNYNLLIWINIELTSLYKYNCVGKYSFNYILEKISFDKSKLKDIFNILKGTDSLLVKLIEKSKNELIYYFFELVEPEYIIKKYDVKLIIKYLISYNNHKMFVFILKHIINLKYDYEIEKLKLSTISSYLSQRKLEYQTEEIAYELVKLGFKDNKDSKYNYNIQIISNNS